MGYELEVWSYEFRFGREMRTTLLEPKYVINPEIADAKIQNPRYCSCF